MVPAVSVNGTSDVERMARTARALLMTGGLLESTATGERLKRTEIAQALIKHLSAGDSPDDRTAGATAGTVRRLAADQTVQAAERALDKLAGGASAANLSDIEVSCLEAIVLVTGRPAMRFTKGRVEMPPDIGGNGPWRVIVATAQSSVDLVASSVGRIELHVPGSLCEIIGTGWRVGADLVVTNRHVVERLVTDGSTQPDLWQIDGGKPAMIDFGRATANERFSFTSLAYVAAEPSADIAILQLHAGSGPFPDPLAIEWDERAVGRTVPQGDASVFQGKQLYVVGHPWRPFSSTAVAAVLGDADGSKRWSPGYATQLETSVPFLEHDCSTLGGSSGSCVLRSDCHKVVALHFGGRGVRELTGMGAANVALPLSVLVSRRVGEILRTGHI
jgi:glutamyl endopeptidase